MERLAELEDADRVIVLSNHLARWLLPHLQQAIAQGLIDHVLVSETTGHVKPQREAYLDVVRLLTPELARPRLLMVDDRPGNLHAARSVGFEVLPASVESAWVSQAARWLHSDEADVNVAM